MSQDKAEEQPESDSAAKKPINGSADEANTEVGAEALQESDLVEEILRAAGADGSGQASDGSQFSADADSENPSGVNADGSESSAEGLADEPQDQVAVLSAQLEDALAKAEENKDLALRTRAEMENLRKRQSRELENAHKYGLDKIAEELLPVRDTLELGVAAADQEEAELSQIVEGTELTLKMLTQAFEKFNILEVDPVGDKFDPDLHQAISMQEGTDQPANTVLSVMQKGYTLSGRLLRPAMVIISK